MFDAKKFASARFTDRTASVPVPDLASWFADDEPAEITVRGLTGEEIAQVREAVETAAAIAAVNGSAGPAAKAAVETIMKLVTGSDKRTPGEYARNLALVRIGAGLDQSVVVRLATNFPVVFSTLAEKIIELTGLGRAPAEK